TVDIPNLAVSGCREYNQAAGGAAQRERDSPTRHCAAGPRRWCTRQAGSSSERNRLERDHERVTSRTGSSRSGFEPVFSAFTSVCARDVRASSRARSFTERGPDGVRYFALNDSRNNVISGSRLSAECASVATKQRTNVEAQ